MLISHVCACLTPMLEPKLSNPLFIDGKRKVAVLLYILALLWCSISNAIS